IPRNCRPAKSAHRQRPGPALCRPFPNDPFAAVGSAIRGARKRASRPIPALDGIEGIGSNVPRRQSNHMNITSEQAEFLNWKILPARLDATQTAWFLGFELHEVSSLVGASLLKPLGHPARNSAKFFATQTLERLRRDEKWLARASDAITNYWKQRNARKKTASGPGRTGNRKHRSTPVLDPISPPRPTLPSFRVPPTRQPHPPPAVVDSLHCARVGPGREFRNAHCAALPSGDLLRTAALRSALRYTLRSVAPFRSRLPTSRPKRTEPFYNADESPFGLRGTGPESPIPAAANAERT